MKSYAVCLTLLAIAAIGIVIAEDQSVPNGTIYGHVYDAKNNTHMSGAFVFCREAKCSKQLVDSDGYYLLEGCFSPLSAYTIECTKFGYKSQKIIAKTNSSGKAKVDFHLEHQYSEPKPDNNIRPGPSIQKSWNKTFSGPYIWSCISAKQTNDGGYIVSGSHDSSDNSCTYKSLIKTDSNGEMVWSKAFNVTSSSSGNPQETKDGGYIFAIFDATNGGGFLIKTDSQGRKQWDKLFEGGVADVQQVNDGGFITIGTSLIKTDSMGNKEWERPTHGDFIQQTSDGGYIIIGSIIIGSIKSGFEPQLIKTDANGNELWNKTIGGSEGDSFASIQQTTDGGYIMVGGTNSYGAGGTDIWLVKSDSEGNIIWDRTFGGAATDVGYSVQQTIDGGFIVVGYTQSYSDEHGDERTWLIKTDKNGNMQWDKFFGRKSEGFSVQQTNDGGYIIAAVAFMASTGSYADLWLIKTDSEGN